MAPLSFLSRRLFFLFFPADSYPTPTLYSLFFPLLNTYNERTHVGEREETPTRWVDRAQLGIELYDRSYSTGTQ